MLFWTHLCWIMYSYSTVYFWTEIISSFSLKTIWDVTVLFVLWYWSFCECIPLYSKVSVQFFSSLYLCMDNVYHLFQVPYKWNFLVIRKVNIRAYAVYESLCIFYVNVHIHIDFLHKHERKNEYLCLCK